MPTRIRLGAPLMRPCIWQPPHVSLLDQKLNSFGQHAIHLDFVPTNNVRD